MIAVKNLKKTYGRGTRSAEEVLHGVSFELPDTGFVCILGRSGSGKTSLLNAIGGLDVFDSGTVEIAGTRVSKNASGSMEKQRNLNFGYVFQNYYLLPEHSAAYNVYLGLHSLDLTEREKIKRVGDALKKVDMLRFRKRLVGELSGGQQQRIAIARALAKNPRVIFADEPTGNLDEESTLNICSLLKKLSKTSLVVMVTHEERLANFFADRIIRIDEGLISSDTTEWERGTLLSADKNTLYTGDYRENTVSLDSLNVRVLTSEGTAPVDITIVVEDGRLLIKTDDERLVMYSKLSVPPYIKEGERPKLDLHQFELTNGEEIPSQPPQKKGLGSGLGLRMLYSELKTTASKKKLRNFASALFIIILSLMLLFSASDIVAAARIDPEEFITADSHVIKLTFDKGPDYNDRATWSISEYVPKFLALYEDRNFDVDYIPDTNKLLTFVSDELPQLGSLSMSFGKYNLANVKRLDASSIICGRMPENYDEIVVDIWVIRKCTDADGIVQNLIPGNEYMLGKRLHAGKNNYFPTIVGICDSGEPTIYMTDAGLLNIGIHGLEAIPYSEFIRRTGAQLAPLAQGEAAVIVNNAGRYYTDSIGGNLTLSTGLILHMKETVEGIGYTYGIDAPIVIADEDVEPFLMNAIETVSHFNIWCADKDAVKRALSSPLPEEYKNVINVDIKDTYYDDYTAFMAARLYRLKTRAIITASVGVLSLVMLYVIQRFRVRDRIGLIAVYRLLGIPGRDGTSIFIMENLLLALKFALPTIFLAWAVVTLLPILGIVDFPVSIPLWLAGLTLLAIMLVETVVAVLAVIRLVSMPPAKLASKYDI